MEIGGGYLSVPHATTMGGSRHKQGVRKGLEKNIQGQNRKGLALRSRTLHQL